MRIDFPNYRKPELGALMPGCVIEEGAPTVRYEAEDLFEAHRAMLMMTELVMQTKFC